MKSVSLPAATSTVSALPEISTPESLPLDGQPNAFAQLFDEASAPSPGEPPAQADEEKAPTAPASQESTSDAETQDHPALPSPAAWVLPLIFCVPSRVEQTTPPEITTARDARVETAAASESPVPASIPAGAAVPAPPSVSVPQPVLNSPEVPIPAAVSKPVQAAVPAESNIAASKSFPSIAPVASPENTEQPLPATEPKAIHFPSAGANVEESPQSSKAAPSLGGVSIKQDPAAPIVTPTVEIQHQGSVPTAVGNAREPMVSQPNSPRPEASAPSAVAVETGNNLSSTRETPSSQNLRPPSLPPEVHIVQSQRPLPAEQPPTRSAAPVPAAPQSSVSNSNISAVPTPVPTPVPTSLPTSTHAQAAPLEAHTPAQATIALQSSGEPKPTVSTSVPGDAAPSASTPAANPPAKPLPAKAAGQELPLAPEESRPFTPSQPARGPIHAKTVAMTPLPTAAPLPESHGTSSAKQALSMQNPEQTTELTGSAEQNLPGQLPARAAVAARAGSSVVATARVDNEKVAAMTSTDANGQFVKAAPESEFSTSAATLPLRTVDRTQDLIALHGFRLRDSGRESLQVVIKPDPNLHLALNVQMRDGAIEVTAQLQRGDHELLNRYWSELQQQLESRGVRLAALTPGDSNSSSGTANNSGFSQQSKQRHTDEEPTRTGAFAEFALQNVLVPRKAAKLAIARGWESWA